MPRIALTGGFGFLGWHTACRLRSRYGVEAVRLGRADLSDGRRLVDVVAGVDAVLHLAGVNRAASEEEVERGNVVAAEQLADAVRAQRRPVRLVYANSIQSTSDNAYGRGKRRAATILEAAAADAGGTFADVLLPNLFGEHGRPGYNSFVATFAHAVAHGDAPTVTVDREVPLLHAQDAAEVLVQAALESASGELRPPGRITRVSDVLDMLRTMHALYARGEVPVLSTSFDVNVFNTYRAYRFPEMFPIAPQVHADRRGELFETVRAHGGTGQAFVSTTRPGAVRGDHYHLHKIERFFVIKGEAEISLRRVLHDDVVTFRLDGRSPSFVDMPTLWVHNIRNVGDEDLITMFWADQLLDAESPDQYPELVTQQGSTP